MLKQQYNLTGKACVEELQTIASLHNNALSNVTKELDSQLSGFNYLNFDFFNALNDMTSHPEKYGKLYIYIKRSDRHRSFFDMSFNLINLSVYDFAWSGFKVADIAYYGKGAYRAIGCGIREY